jgi:surface protein
MYDNSNFIRSQFSHILLFCFVFLKRYLFCGLWWVGLSFLRCTLSFVVFNGASAFNQDVSKWNTGVVTTLAHSKCKLEFYPITILTRSAMLCVFETVPFLLWWWVDLSFSLLHPPLLQCLLPHLRSIRTCPNGIRVWWQIWVAVSVNSVSPFPWPRLPLFCFRIYDKSSFI